jgi:hypothetical protein
VRLDHKDFARLPPLVPTANGLVRMPARGAHPQFRARLVNEAGDETVLNQKRRLRHYKGGYYLGGWLLPGPPGACRGDVLHIESTNGTEVVTFRLP